MTDRPNILVVCGRNKKRSLTAEHVFQNDDRLRLRSAGLSPSSTHRLNEKDLNWSDLVFVMETEQRRRIQGQYGQLDLPPVEVLDIPDEYEYMDEELVDMLTGRINAVLAQAFHI